MNPKSSRVGPSRPDDPQPCREDASGRREAVVGAGNARVESARRRRLRSQICVWRHRAGSSRLRWTCIASPARREWRSIVLRSAGRPRLARSALAAHTGTLADMPCTRPRAADSLEAQGAGSRGESLGPTDDMDGYRSFRQALPCYGPAWITSSTTRATSELKSAISADCACGVQFSRARLQPRAIIDRFRGL